MFKWRHKKRKGFTLVELVIVIVILGILAAIAIPKLGEATKTAEKAAAKATARTILSAVQLAIAENPNVTEPDVAAINKYLSNLTVQTAAPTAKGQWQVTYSSGDPVITYHNGEKAYAPLTEKP